MQSLWPYNTYRPVTWDRYYVSDSQEKQPSVSKSVAEGVTICIFLLVFLFTFGCRIYSQYTDRNSQHSAASELAVSESLASDMWVYGVPRQPPPPYEVAIKMPSTLSPPPPVSPPPTPPTQ